MKAIFFTTLLFSSGLAYSQAETEISEKLANEFLEAFNDGKADAIFEMFNDGMQTAVPLAQVQSIVGGLGMQLGQLKQLEFIEYQGASAKYDASFEKGNLWLFLSHDDDEKIAGLFMRPIERAPKFERNTTPMILPFNEEWSVFWGGDTRAQNYHVDYPNQRGAFDIVIRNEKGSSYETDGKTNEDYFVFGKDLIAPCDAEVIQVIDGVEDNIPGILNPTDVTGNTVLLKTANDEFLLFAHFKNGSILVEEGQKVKQGDFLGQCGNSGNSSEPHLHFHIQDTEDFFTTQGAKCYFEKILVNGEVKEDYSPVQGDRIQNVERD